MALFYSNINEVSENIPETRSVATASLKSFVADTLKGSQNDMSSQNDLGSKRQPSSGYFYVEFSVNFLFRWRSGSRRYVFYVL